MCTLLKTHFFGKSIAVHVSGPWAEDLMFPGNTGLVMCPLQSWSVLVCCSAYLGCCISGNVCRLHILGRKVDVPRKPRHIISLGTADFSEVLNLHWLNTFSFR